MSVCLPACLSVSICLSFSFSNTHARACAYTHTHTNTRTQHARTHARTHTNKQTKTLTHIHAHTTPSLSLSLSFSLMHTARTEQVLKPTCTGSVPDGMHAILTVVEKKLVRWHRLQTRQQRHQWSAIHHVTGSDDRVQRHVQQSGQCGQHVHEADRFTDDLTRCYPTRPADDTRYPNSSFCSSVSFAAWIVRYFA